MSVDKRFMVNQAMEKVSKYFPNLNNNVKNMVRNSIYAKLNSEIESNSNVSTSGCSRDTERRLNRNFFSEEILREIVDSAIASDHLFNCKSTTLNECPEENFVIEHYITDENTNIYPYSVNNMKNVYDNLIKIYQYYKSIGRLDMTGCSIIVIRGIMNSQLCQEYFGDTSNPHSRGLAVDFILLGIEPKDIYENILYGKINLDKHCEVILLRDSLHLGYNKNLDSIKFEKLKEELY